MPETDDDYNPYEHRDVPYPTSDLDTLAHLLKGSLGAGILAMPLAIKHAGLWNGLVGTILIGIIISYCAHILVKNAHRLCFRLKIPQLTFDETAEMAFLVGPKPAPKLAKLAKYAVNWFLSIDLLGCCCVYTMFSAKNLKQVFDFHTEHHCTVREYILMLLPFLLLYVLIRSLKILAPLSLIANVLIIIGLIITFYYTFSDIPSSSRLPAFGPIEELPLFFGIVIFTLEGIGVVMSLENNMSNPAHFTGCPSVLMVAMSFVVAMYATLGFCGYLKYGDKIRGSITLNIPQDEILGQLVKVMFAVAIFQTYGLQFYVPFNIIWRNYKNRFGKWNLLAEYALRYFMVTVTVLIAFAVPKLGPVMSLVGAVTLSFLGLIIPACIDLFTCWETPGLGRFKWRLGLDGFLILFGLVGFFTGTYTSILEIVDFVKG